MNPKVDFYLEDGCGRCEFYKTPQCKVHKWTDELKALRKIVLDCGLNEDFKWSQPCYTYKGKNIIMVTAFKGFSALSFFKGAIMQDPKSLLIAPGENSQAMRYAKFTSVKDILKLESIIKMYIYEAIDLEKQGRDISFKKASEYDMPEEFKTILDSEPTIKEAFYKLTPGRQKGYLLYFSQAIQSKTRTSRIKKYIPRILEGKGFHDR